MSTTAELLRTRGVEQCTVRTIAEAGPFSKSAIHYYFDDIDVLIDLAYESLMERFITHLEEAVAGQAEPWDGVYAASRAYLRMGMDVERKSPAPMWALEMLIVATRRNDVRAPAQVMDRIRQLFRRAVRAANYPRADAVADTLLSALVGAVVRNGLEGRSLDELLDETWMSLSLPPVAALSATVPSVSQE